MSAEVVPLRPQKKPRATTPKVWLSPAMVCEHVPGLTEEILSERRKQRKRPHFEKPSLKTVIYDLDEIDDWVRSTRVVCRDVP